MTSQSIVLQALVSDSEQPAVRQAAERLEQGLSEAGGAPFTVQCRFSASLEHLDRSAGTPIVIASLLAEVSNYQEPWQLVEHRLRKTFQEFLQQNTSVLFICTVFRHVSRDESEEQAKRLMIRRLNLLATELSRETGAFVIDLDRCFADIGARKLETDYRLIGPYAARAAGKFIALAILSAGLDDHVAYEIQDAAMAAIRTSELDLVVPVLTAPDLVPSNVLKLGAGRRKQVVATVVDTNQGSHAGKLIQLIVTRQFGVSDALEKLRNSMARRGFRATVSLIFAAIGQALRSGQSRIGR